MTDDFRASLPQHAYDANKVQLNERQVATQCGIKMPELMAMAGKAAFDNIRIEFPTKKAWLIYCGKGNNGGDGCVIAKLAMAMGLSIHVIILARENQVVGDAKYHLNQLQDEITQLRSRKERDSLAQEIRITFNDNIEKVGIESSEKSYDLVVDAIFGIGFNGSLNPSYQNLIEGINLAPLPRVSIDVPSGLNASAGAVKSLAVKATLTISFIALKQGLITGKSPEYTGKLVVEGLSLQRSFHQTIVSDCFVLNKFENAKLHSDITIPNLPKRSPISHKGTFGTVLLIGGNKNYPGAISLASESALRTGAALVAVCCHSENRNIVFSKRPELMIAANKAEDISRDIHFSKAKALVIGPGLSVDEWASALFDEAIKKDVWKVVDADALRILTTKSMNEISSYSKLILTPHPGEAAALLACSIEDIETDRFTAIKKIAEKYGAICVLKGAGTLISDGKTIWINTTGNAGMASGGMGDVLSGIIGALLTQFEQPLSAVKFGVFIHGLAADNIARIQGQRGMIASDIIQQLPALVNQEFSDR